MVKIYQIKQAFRLGGERFEIKDQRERVDYRVEGSFLKVPKTFTIYDREGKVISHISKEFLTLLPRFAITMADGQVIYLKKQLTFFKDRYTFDGLSLTLEGNIWDLTFTLKEESGQEVAKIEKEVFRLTSTYQLTIVDESYTDLVVSLAVALDYVDMLENRS